MTILLSTAILAAALLYCGAWLAAARTQNRALSSADIDAGGGASRSQATAGAAASAGDYGATLMLGGVIAHALAIAAASGIAPFTPALAGVRFGFAPALSAVLWIGIAILWFEGLRLRLQALRLLILPIGVIAVSLPLFFPGADLSKLVTAPLFLPHLVVGTMAIGVFFLAALLALLMTAAERSLHQRSQAARSLFVRWCDQLPPLMALERLLFRFIWVGFALLSLTVASGVLFSEQVFGRAPRFDHKTTFTIAAWFLFGALLLGRYLRGWRGKTAVRLTVSGTLFLLLAYVGSRFVLEVILHR